MEIEPVMATIGASLLSLTFIYTFCQESIDLKSEMTMKSFVKIMTKLVIGNAIMINYVKIMKQLFEIGGAFVSLIGDMDGLHMEFSEDMIESLATLSFMESHMFWIFGLIIFILIVVSGLTIVYVAIYRFFKIFMLLPFGAIAFATLAGSGQMSQTGVAFLKTMFTYIFEPAMIAMALAVASLISSSGFNFLDGIAATGWLAVLVKSLDFCMTCGICVGAVKGSEALLRRGFNLN